VGTFISSELAARIPHVLTECAPTQFMTTDGTPMTCGQKVQGMHWMCQGHTFVSDVGVLPLKCFDMILGQDWLENVSPMWIHWSDKIMRFTHQGKRITLQGLQGDQTQCPIISEAKLKGLLNRSAITHCVQLVGEIKRMSFSGNQYDRDIIAVIQEHEIPESVQKLIHQFEDVFATPNSLPPQRPFDHHIQLMPGAQPVNIRTYRYSPVQKSEIEKQVKEMLQNGIIKHSTSPYASPVLLVRKKDGTWRFCIDYRHLNAQTVKNKHPMLVVEELMDELARARWFTKLDLRAGYHQICIDQADTYKTAFKTHEGLYEFLVMPFGLTNAPATFQGIMNLIFAPLLRKGVLVFMDDILIYSKSLEEHLALLQQVFEILRQNKFFVKMSKCSFAQPKVEYLGHTISAGGVATEQSKVLAIQEWSTPKNLKELRGFLGLTGYYRRFVKHYGLISRPLSNLLRKGCRMFGPQ
jgi:hypothetical protein